MAYYLVTARPRPARMNELEERLRADEFRGMQPFGEALSDSLTHVRRKPDGTAVWEEEDYCHPPLAQERAAVLDEYFDELHIEPVKPSEGWKLISDLPLLFSNRAMARDAHRMDRHL